MTDSARRVYRTIGSGFLLLGGGVALVSLLDRIFTLGFFRASPLGTGLFLVAIGALLLQAVAQAERQAGAAAGEEPKTGREEPPRP
jgi:hypothetical protein